jgi:hypothetical protein
MEHLHFEVEAGPRDTLEVVVDRAANVLLLDHDNYWKYCQQQEHSCYGGYVETGSALLKPYRVGRWHIVVDMGRSGGQVAASVRNKATGQTVGKAQSKYLRGA